jgi:hypothetical protein
MSRANPDDLQIPFFFALKRCRNAIAEPVRVALDQHNQHKLPEQKDPDSRTIQRPHATQEPMRPEVTSFWLPSIFPNRLLPTVQPMNDQPQTASSTECDLIESMLHRQEQVLTGLDDLFDRIDAVIGELTEQRKREAAEANDFLQFGPTPTGSPIQKLDNSDEQSDQQLGRQEKAA